jgi:hypothetical protein
MTRYTKTAAGEAELLNKTLGLNFIERSTLLMVNGKRSVADISVPLGSLGNIEETIAKLIAQGLVEIEAAQIEAVTPTNYLESLYACRSAATLLIRRSLESAMGQNADMFMLKLESAVDKTKFIQAVENALMALGNERGTEAKNTLVSKLQLLNKV